MEYMGYEHIEYIISIFIFIFGIITWIPFLNGVYGTDVAGGMYVVDIMKRGKLVPYKDLHLSAIGHYYHMFAMQRFWKKENTKAFYWIMCLYSSLSAVVLFWVMFYLFGIVAAIIGSMIFSLYIVSPRLDGNWGPFEQLLPLPLLASILCMLISSQSSSYSLIILSGLLFGYSVLNKQITAIYLPGYLLMLIGTNHSFSYNLIFVGAVIAINIIPILYYWLKHDALFEYLTSTWLNYLPIALNPKKYNKIYPKHQTQGEKSTDVARKIILINSRSLLPIIFLSTIGIICLFSFHFSLIFVGLFICLILSVSTLLMRRTYFAHYWLNMIPWLAIFSGFGLSEIIHNVALLWPVNAVTVAGMLAVILLFIDAILVDRKFYVFSKDPYAFLQKVWGQGITNSYKIWKKIGEYIKDTTNQDDKILICGTYPQILLYSNRTHFTTDLCLHTKDYLDIYNRENPTYHHFLNSIYKFKNLKIVKQKENVFHKGHPEVILFGPGEVDIEGFEKLTGIKYHIDENVKGYTLYRADLELTELMSMYGKTNTERLPSEESINLKKNDLINSVNKQDWNTALETTKHLLTKAPQNRELLSILGDCLIKLGNFKLLFGFYNRLIGEKNTSVRLKLELLSKLGVAYCGLNKLNEAEALFKKILGAKPDNPVVLNNLGYVYNKQNKVGEAVECFQKSLKIDPNNADAIHNLGQIKAQCA